MIRFIGDIHGRVPEYLHLIDDQMESVQIGDFGFGFGEQGKPEFLDSLIDTCAGNHRFIRGNHDSPVDASMSTHYIQDGTIDDNIMFMGGALSIDKQWRIPGIDWWPDEELSEDRLVEMIDIFAKNKPTIFITHECPEFIARDVMIPAVNGFSNFPSRTRRALDVMYGLSPRPKLHIFGHWHKFVDVTINGTRFVCLPELGYADIDVSHEFFKR